MALPTPAQRAAWRLHLLSQAHEAQRRRNLARIRLVAAASFGADR